MNDTYKTVKCGDNTLLKYPKEATVLRRLEDNKEIGVTNFVTGCSDLLPGVYEGGFKIWECSIDLCKYIAGFDELCSSASVLEIGCGAGLPGILALLRGAKTCCFQDFNDTVLQYFTSETIRLNCPERETNCTLIPGSWSESFDSLPDKSCDLVLSSETIYSEDSYEQLHSVLDRVLTQNGKIIMAAKYFYFGVGGSVPAWIDFVQSKAIFNIESVKEIDSSVPRSILQLTRVA